MKNLIETIQYALDSFDRADKGHLSQMIVEALEMKKEGDAVERAESVLKRTLSDEEKLRLKTLARIYFSKPQYSLDAQRKGRMSY